MIKVEKKERRGCLCVQNVDNTHVIPGALMHRNPKQYTNVYIAKNLFTMVKNIINTTETIFTKSVFLTLLLN